MLLGAERFDEADRAIEKALARNKSDADLERVLEGRVFDAGKAYKAAIRVDGHNAPSTVFRASSKPLLSARKPPRCCKWRTPSTSKIL